MPVLDNVLGRFPTELRGSRSRLRCGLDDDTGQSSLFVVAAVTYDAGLGTMDVEFRHGEVYRYFLVPRVIFREFVEAPSAGRFFAERIRSRFRETRLS